MIELSTLREHGSPCACYPIMAAGTAVGPVRRAAAPASPLRPVPSAGLPPAADRRPDHLRKAGPGPAVRLLVCVDRRRRLLGDHDPRPPRRVDRPGIFAQLKQIAVEAYDRIAGLVLQEILIGGCITKAPGGGECAGRSPVDRGKQGMKRSLMTDGHGIPLDRVLARPPGTTPRCWHPRWTSSMTSARCPQTSGSTWTPGTTPTKPATNWPGAAWPGNRPQRREGTPPGRAALARRADERLAQRLRPAATLLRAPRGGDRRILRPRRRHHHRPWPDPPGMDHLPLGRPPGPTTVTAHLFARPLSLRNDSGPAFRGDSMVVDQRACLRDGFEALGAGEFGAVRLNGARIGLLLCDSAKFVNNSGPVLVALAMHVERGIFMRDGFEAVGAWRGRGIADAWRSNDPP